MVTEGTDRVFGGRPRIAHVAQIEVDRGTGMGRVAWSWLRAFEDRGYETVHIGPGPGGEALHPAQFPWWARREVLQRVPDAAAILVHEPAGLPFVGPWRLPAPTIVFSHGLERRGWEVAKRLRKEPEGGISLRSLLSFPMWRILPAELAVRWAPDLLVLNREDLHTAIARYGRDPGRTHLYANGVDPVASEERSRTGESSVGVTALFLGSYLARKGTSVLTAAAAMLDRRDVPIRWWLAGTGTSEERVLETWPPELRGEVRVIPRFEPEQEQELLAQCDLFVLPSLFEGQPLSLLQAMAAGRCCVATDTCGQKDLLRNGENGLLVTPGDPTSLANALELASRDPELRTRLGAQARRDVAGRTWEQVSQRVVDTVERAIGLQRPGRRASRHSDPEIGPTTGDDPGPRRT